MKTTSFRFSRAVCLRSLVAAVLALALFVSPVLVGAASAASNYRVGSIVTFGSYEQDNIRSNGSEPIEWIILEVKSDRMLLLSRYALDSEPYHYRSANVDWDTCSVRDWLNDTFMNEAFSRSEQKSLLYSNTSRYTDYVFLLSDAEAETYMPRAKDRICKPTYYCSCQNVYVNPTTGGSWWLLRTTGDGGSKLVMSVNSDGAMDYRGGRVESDRGTVRPAIWVKI